MDNVGEENTPIGEEHMDDTSVIEKEKKPRKKRETHSPAQLETLKRGREKLAQKRQKQREAKKVEPVNDMLQNFEKKCNEILENLEKKIHQTKIAPKNNDEYTEIMKCLRGGGKDLMLRRPVT